MLGKTTNRMLATSTASTAVDVVTLLALAGMLAVPAGTAAVLGCLAGGVVSFVLSRHYVFGAAAGCWKKQLLGYGVLVVLGGALLSGAIVRATVLHLGAPVLLAKGVAATVVMVAWNYPLSARLIFSTGRES